MAINWKYSTGVKEFGKRYELWWYRKWDVRDFGILFDSRPGSYGMRHADWNVSIGFIGIKAVLTKYKYPKE